ncbi:RNA 3'-terminal phosphate cyclase [Gautieria morchelliformis]|nr:RNA 3'-terminal phosphate cyclase [Gautieria morchelliformis]
MAAPASSDSTTLIDGSVLEGGGQLIRNAVAFSVLLSRPISISNIRQNRNPKGFKPQHVAGVKLAAEICDARIVGVEKGSEHLYFHPGRPKVGNYLADTGTAGSTTLLLQIALPCLLFSSPSPLEALESILALRGGTNAIAAPQIDYTTQVFLPFLRRHFHLQPTLDIQRRGYYPRGGGKVVLSIPHSPGPLPSFNLTFRGNITAIKGKAYVAGTLPSHIARKMADAARLRLVSCGVDHGLIDIEVGRDNDNDATGSGSGIILWAETDGSCIIGGGAIGSKGTDAGKTGDDAAEELARNLKHGGCVDDYLQDQIIIFMALAKGKSTVATGPLTMHTKTAVWLAEKLSGAKFQIEDEHGTARTILSCEGIGLASSSSLNQ